MGLDRFCQRFLGVELGCCSFRWEDKSAFPHTEKVPNFQLGPDYLERVDGCHFLLMLSKGAGPFFPLTPISIAFRKGFGVVFLLPKLLTH